MTPLPPQAGVFFMMKKANSDPTGTRAFRELCRLAGKAIHRYRMIGGGERILLGLSGGKDSLTMMHVLVALRRRAPVDFELIPAVFDPGWPEFGLPELADYCRRADWQLAVAAAPVADILREKGEKNPCMLCSRLRRGHLYKLAGALSCTHLALGQHFDDAAVSFLISLVRGQGLTTMGPNVAARRETLRIIRPLILAPESLIAEAAAAFDFPAAGNCRYRAQLDADGDRAYFKRLLQQLETRIPHYRSQMLHSLENIREEHLFDRRFCLPPGEQCRDLTARPL